MAGPVFSDKLNHASVAEALRSIPRGFHRYRHGDMTHLESLLQLHLGGGKGPGLVVTETLFSMDGDIAPLEALLDLQERHGFFLYLDEAHSTGCRPDLLETAMRRARPGRLLAMGTFGKAYGGFGAYLAGPEPVIEYLVNTARSFIFSTALPPSALGAALAALEVAESEPWRREKLYALAARTRELLRGRGFDIGASGSHIVPVIAGSNADTVSLSAALFGDGFHAPPVRHPTVPEGTARLRINLTAEMEDMEMKALADALEKAREAAGIGKGKGIDIA
jgi:8-amino-7-oxononanoate synthase